MAPKTPVSTPSACKKKRWENKNKTTVEKQRQARPKIKSTLSAGNETAESKLLSKLKTCRRYEGAVGRAPTSDDWGAATVAPQRATCRKARMRDGISPIAPLAERARLAVVFTAFHDSIRSRYEENPPIDPPILGCQAPEAPPHAHGGHSRNPPPPVESHRNRRILSGDMSANRISCAGWRARRYIAAMPNFGGSRGRWPAHS